MEQRSKYPRTHHLPWSLGATRDDLTLQNTDHFVGQEVVVTEKRDGENTTLYRDGLHARSIDSQDHPSRAWVRRFRATFAHDIPAGMRICGENLYARHSIAYTNLTTYFEVFSVWQDEVALSWDETAEWCNLLGLTHVPVLYRGIWDEQTVQACYTPDRKPNQQEGYVVRLAGSFQKAAFATSLAKFVRQGHVQPTAQHWQHASVVPNQIAK